MNLFKDSFESNYVLEISIWQVLNMKNINDRFRNLVMHVTSEGRRYKELEELSGISSATWKTFWTRGGFPSAQMLEAINTKFPHFAFWLATGIQDSEHGHLSPNNPNLVDIWDMTAYTTKEDLLKTAALLKLLTEATQKVFLIELKMNQLREQHKAPQAMDEFTYQSELTNLLFNLEMALEIRNQHQISYSKLKDSIEKKLKKSRDEYHKYLMSTVLKAKDIATEAEERAVEKVQEESSTQKAPPIFDIPI